MEQLASLLMQSRNQTHIFHLGVKGPGAFAAHLALQGYYEGIIPLLDGLVEAYQGQYGLIKFQAVNGLDNNCEIKNIISYFEKLCKAVDKLRKDEKLQTSWFQNEIDNIVILLYSTKYKLTYLQ